MASVSHSAESLSQLDFCLSCLEGDGDRHGLQMIGGYDSGSATVLMEGGDADIVRAIALDSAAVINEWVV